jgi:hypothetical protein
MKTMLDQQLESEELDEISREGRTCSKLEHASGAKVPPLWLTIITIVSWR